jgi:hypothetical protein
MKDIAATDGSKVITRLELMASNVLLIVLKLDVQGLIAAIGGWTRSGNVANML